MNKRRIKKNSATTVVTTTAAAAITNNAQSTYPASNLTASTSKNKATIPPPPRRRLEEVNREKANSRAKVSRYNPLHDRGASLAVSIASSLENEFELYGYEEKEQGCEFERIRQRQHRQDEVTNKASAKKEKKDDKKRRTSNDGSSTRNGNSGNSGSAGGRTPTSEMLTTARRNHNDVSTLELSPAKSYNHHRRPSPRRPTPSPPARREDDVDGSTATTGWAYARSTYINEYMCYLACGLCKVRRREGGV